MTITVSKPVSKSEKVNIFEDGKTEFKSSVFFALGEKMHGMLYRHVGIQVRRRDGRFCTSMHRFRFLSRGGFEVFFRCQMLVKGVMRENFQKSARTPPCQMSGIMR